MNEHAYRNVSIWSFHKPRLHPHSSTSVLMFPRADRSLTHEKSDSSFSGYSYYMNFRLMKTETIKLTLSDNLNRYLLIYGETMFCLQSVDQTCCIVPFFFFSIYTSLLSVHTKSRGQVSICFNVDWRLS